MNSQANTNPYQINIETVIGASPMLGHRLENRMEIRNQQQLDLLSEIDQASRVNLADLPNADTFVVAPLDILVSRSNGKPQFHIIELNGTGIGGVSNLPDSVVGAMVGSIQQAVAAIGRDDGIVLLPVSGKESDDDPRLNKLMHEKMVFAQAMAQGLNEACGDSQIVTLCGLQSGKQALTPGVPAVVIGYLKELTKACTIQHGGQVTLNGRQVLGALNDRFCLNLFSEHPNIDLDQFQAINGTYLAGGDKGVAYRLLDEHLLYAPSDNFPNRVHHDHATNAEELKSIVLDWIAQGRKPVIKPHGTGIGHGIEFFLNLNEPESSVEQRIDDSIRLTDEYYGTTGGAFPYTICEFVESDQIEQPNHHFHGHKFEVRVAVYRDGSSLRACPAIAKVAPQAYDANNPNRDNLINNITNAAVTGKTDGTNFMLPLCNEETLSLLNISKDELIELCRVCTEFVKHAITEIPHQNHQMRAILKGQNALRKSSLPTSLASFPALERRRAFWGLPQVQKFPAMFR